METFAAVMIFWGIVWIIKESIDDSKNKKDAEKQRQVYAENMKATRAKDLKQRHSLLNSTRNSLNEWLKNTDLSRDEVNWLNDILDRKTNEELESLSREIESSPSKASEDEILGIKQAYYEAKIFVMEQTKIREDREEWDSYVQDFRRLNTAQQGYEIKRLKKVADPNSDEDNERIRLLELIKLQEPTSSGDTDILVGGVKLFTMRRK